MLRKSFVALAVCAGLAALTAAAVSSGRQDPDRTPTSAEVAGRVMSPFCPGLSLEECPSEQASELRARIQRRIAAGATNAEIDRWLIADYGESVLGRPPGALWWMVPAAFVLGGLACILYLLSARTGARSKSRTEARREEAGSASPASSKYRPRMLQELSSFDKGTE